MKNFMDKYMEALIRRIFEQMGHSVGRAISPRLAKNGSH